MTIPTRVFGRPKVGSVPDFANIEAVLQKQTPGRPTLFEFFLNSNLYADLGGGDILWGENTVEALRGLTVVFRNAGYDYATWPGSDLAFPTGDDELGGFRAAGTTLIHDRASFDAYPWPNPDKCDYSPLDDIKDDLPDGMRLIVHGPGGVLENVVELVGFEDMCYMIVDDPQLATDVFERIGSIIRRHYELAAAHDSVGACISNDDWGFKTQPMLSPDNMREYVFPQHRRIVEAIHAAGKPAILHSCGNQETLYDGIIDDLRYDGKHSYEDAIQPVEEAYEQYGERIAILGGIDLDYVCRSTPQEVYDRSRAMLERTSSRGAYALGTGNSVPEYVPFENYYAMITAALEDR